jgi:hypothetical protein
MEGAYLERPFGAGPVEHGQRDGHRDVDADLSGLGVDFEFTAGSTVVGLSSAAFPSYEARYEG